MGYIIFFGAMGALLWETVVFKILWGWFFVPIFSLPNLSFAEALGIMAILGLLSSRYVKKEKDDKETIRRLHQGFSMPLVCLALGAIARLFI